MVAAGIFVLSGIVGIVLCLDVEEVFLSSEFITRFLNGFVVRGCFLRVVSTTSFSDCSLLSLSFSEEVFLGSEFITRVLIGFVVRGCFLHVVFTTSFSDYSLLLLSFSFVIFWLFCCPLLFLITDEKSSPGLNCFSDALLFASLKDTFSKTLIACTSFS